MKLQNLTWEQFLKHITQEHQFSKNEASLAANKSRFNIIKKYFADIDFNRENFLEFLDEGDKLGWSNPYKNKFIAAATHIVEFLEITDFKRIPYRHEKHKAWSQGYLTQEEIIRIAKVKIKYAKYSDVLNTRNEALGLLMAFTGCRIGEAINLQQEEVLDRESGKFVCFKDTKNGEDRFNNIPEFLYKDLKALGENGYVFVSARTGKKLRSNEIGLDWKRRAKACGIDKPVTNHLFRHSFITRNLRAHTPIQNVSLAVGHKDPRVTMLYEQTDLQRIADNALDDPMRSNEWTFERGVEKILEVVKRSVNKNMGTPEIRENRRGLYIFLPRM